MSDVESRLVILSDTHGRLPEVVCRSCEGAEAVIHAGDVGSRDILPELKVYAPVTVVAGNVDPYELAPTEARLESGGWRILVRHVVWERGGPSREVNRELERVPADLVVFGHTHEPLCRRVGTAVFLNPGSCGAKRFSLPRAFAEVLLTPEAGCFRVFDLEAPAGAPPLIEKRFSRDSA